jgi:hypothetical protein
MYRELIKSKVAVKLEIPLQLELKPLLPKRKLRLM